MSAIDFASELNEEQLAAVQAPDGPVLIIAAAGTGKTRTLTYRVAYLVEKGIDASRILLLTFTNKAAREMLERAQVLVGESVGGLWGGTFHHMANRILRQYASAIGYRNDYTILDQDDSRTLVKQSIDALGLTGKHFPKPDVLLGVYGLASSTEQSVLSLAETRFGGHEINVDDIVKVHVSYEQKKRDLNAMDFDDLLSNGLKLFRDHPDIARKYRERFLYVMVDEYQDTNVIQAEWVDTIAAGSRNLLVVGDDFQSIYSWRGADFRNIMSFPKRYPDAKVFKLETNYRSVPEILDVANACIAGNPEQFQKTLRAVREKSQRPHVSRVRNGEEQAFYVIDRIHRLRSEGYKLSQIAILYRAHFHAMELQLELSRQRIPYVITSGMRFFEQAHIKDVCSIIRILNNTRDGLALSRLLELFPKMGRKTVSKIWDAFRGSFDAKSPQDRLKLGSLLPAMAKPAWKGVEEIFANYEKDDLKSDAGETIRRFVDCFYDNYAVETFDNYDRRIEDIEELINFTTKFESDDQFLGELSLLTNLDAEADALNAASQDAVRLSTIHQAKGLEWEVVFLLWLADGMFPSARSIADTAGEAEERRLFYVASTRAKDELFMCVPGLRRTKDGGTQFYAPSRFVQELPPKLMQEDYAY